MGQRLIVTLASIIGVATVFAGCGGSEPTPEEIAAERATLVQALAAEVTARDSNAAKSRENACRSHVGRALAFMKSQPQLSSFGIAALDTYRGRLVTIQDEIDQIPRESLSPACLRVVGALNDAATYHSEAVGEWLECDFDYPYSCTNWIEVCARKNPPKDLCDYTKFNTYESSELAASIQVLTAILVKGDWQSAARKTRSAQRLLSEIGTATPAVTTLPRSRLDVPQTVYGRTLQLLCSAEQLPTAAQEPCQGLRDLLVQGVSPEEEKGLNDVLRGVVDAYELPVSDETA
jgi:hypothetical protein